MIKKFLMKEITCELDRSIRILCLRGISTTVCRQDGKEQQRTDILCVSPPRLSPSYRPISPHSQNTRAEKKSLIISRQQQQNFKSRVRPVWGWLPSSHTHEVTSVYILLLFSGANLTHEWMVGEKEWNNLTPDLGLMSGFLNNVDTCIHY